LLFCFLFCVVVFGVVFVWFLLFGCSGLPPQFDQEIFFLMGLDIWFLLQFDLLTATIVTMSAAMAKKNHLSSFLFE